MIAQVRNSCLKFPDRNAFFIEGNFYTYSFFAQQISDIRQAISQKSTSEKLIGLLISDDIETYSGIFGILFSGAGYVPLHSDFPPERNAIMAEQAGLKLIISSKTIEETQKIIGTNNIQIISTANLPATKINLDLPNINPTDPAYVLFTSGSTGIPKGVPISYNNINSFMNAFYALGYEIDENDRFLQVFDLSFDLSVMSYLAPLQIGACAYTVASGKTKYLATYALLEEQELTFALMVPSVLNYLKPYFDDIRLEKLRYSLFCGEALYDDITSQWANCVPNALIQNVYGPTEATIFCLTYDWKADHRPEKAFNGIVSIGKPMKNMGAVVVDSQSKIVADGEKGELCLLGGQLTAGYWNNPEKNAQAFFTTQINGVETVCYRTGDIAFVDKDGDFTFCGRVDHQVKVQGGYRVELSEIEHYARQFTNLNVAAVAKENAMGISQIYLFLEKYEGKIEELSNFMIEKLPTYMQPSKILNLDIFPLNVNGKIDRKVLKSGI